MSELTDRMRTCAAYLLARSNAGEPWAVEIVANDAADLLVEASNVIAAAEPAEPLGEPMTLLEAASAPVAPEPPPPIATWTAAGDTLPGFVRSAPRSPKACPQCDSRTAKKVFRRGRTLMLACPVCAKEWPYG